MYIYVQQQREHNFNIIRCCLLPRIEHSPNPPASRMKMIMAYEKVPDLIALSELQ